MKWTECLTLGIALLGAALGVFNTVHGWRRARARLRVDAAIYVPRVQRDLIKVTIRNLSAFALTVEKIEVFQRGVGNLDIYCRGLPVAVEARAPLALDVIVRAKNYDFARGRLRILATTSCGLRASARVK